MIDENVVPGGRRRGPPPTLKGYAFDEAASAYQKAIRRGQEDDAVHFALDLADSGYGAYAWRRLLTITSEDVGLASEHLPATIWALHETARHLQAAARGGRQGVGRLQLIHATLLLARARKSRIVDHLLIAHSGDETVREIVDVAVDKHTRRGRAMGRGWEHFWADGSLLADVETGELTAEGSLPDAYRERARQATARTAGSSSPEVGPKPVGPLPEPQLTLDEEREP